MLLPNEMNEVRKNKNYKKYKNPFINLKYTIGIKNEINDSANVKLNFNEKFEASMSITIKFIALIFKPIMISKEIGEIRNEIVEIFLNDTLDNSVLYDILEKDCYCWMEYKQDKVNFIRVLAKEFLCDSKIQQTIFDACNHPINNQKSELYKITIRELDELFGEIIKDCRQKNLTDDIFSTIVNNGTDKKELIKMFIEHGKSGLLTDE